MYTKIRITGKITVKTGMHIGGSSAYAAIGAVDSPIIKDVRTNLPMLPGSSFKGKMRSLLAREYNTDAAEKPDDDDSRLTRLFGSARKNAVKRSRILVSDMIMENADELRKQGIESITEVKFENSINRLTAVANPRQIERAVRDTVFPMDLIYEVENGKEDEVTEDMETIAEGLRLLQYDYIGGNGSRGYGRISVSDVKAETVIGQLDAETFEACSRILEGASVEAE